MSAKIVAQHPNPRQLVVDVPENGLLSPKTLRALAASGFSLDGAFEHMSGLGWTVSFRRDASSQPAESFRS